MGLSLHQNGDEYYYWGILRVSANEQFVDRYSFHFVLNVSKLPGLPAKLDKIIVLVVLQPQSGQN